jgi:hypothetical protein
MPENFDLEEAAPGVSCSFVSSSSFLTVTCIRPAIFAFISGDCVEPSRAPPSSIPLSSRLFSLCGTFLPAPCSLPSCGDDMRVVSARVPGIEEFCESDTASLTTGAFSCSVHRKSRWSVLLIGRSKEFSWME